MMCFATVVAAVLLSVFVLSPALAQTNGTLRLVGGLTSNEGRVEVFFNGKWGTICDDSWHLSDADVICRQLGFEKALRVHHRAKFGQGIGPIWIDQIRCTQRDASSILQCDYNELGNHDCSHSEDAGVTCERKKITKPSSMPVRLSCPKHVQNGTCQTWSPKRGPNPGECTPQIVVQGIVEVFYDNQWKPLSNREGWNDKSAQTVCLELGYPLMLGRPFLNVLWSDWHAGYCTNYIDQGSGGADNTTLIKSGCTEDALEENKEFRVGLTNYSWLQGLDCTGLEGRLVDCHFDAFGPFNITLAAVATVRCGFKPHPDCDNSSKEVYRLRGGPNDWKGRLEVKVKGKWGTVCDISFDQTEGNIVCRAMGYGAVTNIYHRALFGRGVGERHYSHLRCNGSELYLADCSDKRHPSRCHHDGDVGIRCTIPPLTPEPMSRLITAVIPRTSQKIDGFLELKVNNKWGVLCGGILSTFSMDLVCRQHRGEFYRDSYSQNLTGIHSSVRYVGIMICKGDETILEDCIWRLREVTKCPKDEVYIRCTPNLPDLVPDVEEYSRSLRSYPYIQSIPMYYLTCALEENCLSSSAAGKPYNHYRRLLRFSTKTMNWGSFDFTPSIPQNEWLWHTCHNHYHSFESFIHYDLLDYDGNMVAEGHKASFCLEDSTCVFGGTSRYRCGSGYQGISMNCGDVYSSHLDCQWIDVTDLMDKIDNNSSVPNGGAVGFKIQQHVNPSKLQEENDYRNNIVTCDIVFYKGLSYYRTSNCVLSDH